jgi:hypothetical protein
MYTLQLLQRCDLGEDQKFRLVAACDFSSAGKGSIRLPGKWKTVFSDTSSGTKRMLIRIIFLVHKKASFEVDNSIKLKKVLVPQVKVVP